MSQTCTQNINIHEHRIWVYTYMYISYILSSLASWPIYINIDLVNIANLLTFYKSLKFTYWNDIWDNLPPISLYSQENDQHVGNDKRH